MYSRTVYQEEVEDNPYHRLLLEGHDHAVRALAARGRTLVSGSYDCTVRVWDIITGQSKWVLVGHSQKGLYNLQVISLRLIVFLLLLVYSVVLDPNRNQACSGSMDGTVRVWNLITGQCVHTLTGHTSLVGLLGLSPSYLVSAAADSTLRVWDPESGDLKHTLQAHTGAITCFQHDEFKVLSGSDGTLKMWDIRDGTFVRDLLTNINGVWQVVFEGRWCVAASNRLESTVLDVWDFGRHDGDDDWVGEPPGGLYDDSSDDDDDDQADADAMDQDLEVIASDPEILEDEIEADAGGPSDRSHTQSWSFDTPENRSSTLEQQMGSPWAPDYEPVDETEEASSSRGPRIIPSTDHTPSRPRRRSVNSKRR